MTRCHSKAFLFHYFYKKRNMKWVREDLNAKQLDKNAGQLEKVIEQIGRLKRAMFLPRSPRVGQS